MNNSEAQHRIQRIIGNGGSTMSVHEDLDVISREELKEKIDGGDGFELVEVLAKDEYEKFHLPGAINIPGDRLREQAPERIPDKDREIVVYCASPACQASSRAAKLLTDMGYTSVKDYAGGKQHWREGGLPVEETSSRAAEKPA